MSLYPDAQRWHKSTRHAALCISASARKARVGSWTFNICLFVFLQSAAWHREFGVIEKQLCVIDWKVGRVRIFTQTQKNKFLCITVFHFPPKCLHTTLKCSRSICWCSFVYVHSNIETREHHHTLAVAPTSVVMFLFQHRNKLVYINPLMSV